ncbi:PP2C family protein-serine/threonine phosphatase [Leptothoe sp. EHU-05/26/07-4]
MAPFNRLQRNSVLHKTLWLLGGYAFFLIAALSSAVYYVANSVESIHRSTLEFDELNREVEIINDYFNRQAKDRKNLFLRGHNSEDLAKYLDRVNDMTVKIEQQTNNVLQYPLAEPYRKDLEQLLKNHALLMDTYTEGVQIFKQTQDPRAGDQYVRGEGGEVGEELTHVLKQIDLDRQTLTANNQSHIRAVLLISTGGLIVFILVCSGVLAFAVTDPMRRISRFTTFLDESRQARLSTDTREHTEFGTTTTIYQPLEGKRYDEIGYMVDTYEKLSSLIGDYSRTLEKRVQERTAQLASANTQIMHLNQKLAAENVRMSAELEVSRQLQALILPKEKELKQIHQLDIATFMEPAEEFGGDYFDVLQFNGRTQIGIGDVTGHGLESGMLMLMAQTAVRTLLLHGESDSAKVLKTLNQTIYANVQRMNSERNMTLSLLDYSGGKVSLTGQHEEVIIVRKDGGLERIDTIDLGFPLGLESDISEFIDQTHINLDPGDGIVLYTDGITEAENSDGTHYGLPRLCELVQLHWHLPAEEIRRRVIQDVQTHIGTHKVFDDITLLVLKRPTMATVNLA